MRIPQLDERLQAALDMFVPCAFGADIGADHGHLSCSLLSSGKCERMIVSDISADSLQKAQRLLAMHGFDARAEIRVADGFSALLPSEEIACAALCGIGGQLMAKLLKKASVLPPVLILSANTDIPLVRKTLGEIGYHIAQEKIVRAKKRFYIVLRAEQSSILYSERELYLGPILLKEKPPLWRDYLRWREGVVSCESNHEQQLTWIREELAHEKSDGTNCL